MPYGDDPRLRLPSDGMSITFRFVATVLGLLGSIGPACGQGCWQVQDRGSYPGPNGTVRVATVWDPDGAGPAGELLVFGGDFLAAGNVAANRIATFDPATGVWAPLGTGIYLAAGGTPAVLCLATMADGSLAVGGYFAPAGGQWAADGVARWDGTAWHRLGLGITNVVYQLVTLPNGDLVAGGSFIVTGTSITNLARWDGTAWSAIGTTVTGGVRGLLVTANGDLVVVWLSSPLSSQVRVSRWDGATWSTLGTDRPGTFTAITELANGDLVLTGSFTVGSQYGVLALRYDGVDWLPVGQQTGIAGAAVVVPGGDLVVSHSNGLKRWDGTSWSSLDSVGILGANTLVPLANGELLIGGGMQDTHVIGYQTAVRLSGSNWSPIGDGIDASVQTATCLDDGSFVVGGRFRQLADLRGSGIARWNGTSWDAMGGLPASIDALIPRANGHLWAIGSMASVSGTYEWDGSTWTTLPYWELRGGLERANGELVVFGPFTVIGGVPANQVARWNGVTWAPLGAGPSGTVRALCEWQGDLIACGEFSGGGNPAYGVARWDGSVWTMLGTGGPYNAKHGVVLEDGSLVVDGELAYQLGVWRWDGLTWQSIGAVPGGGSIASLDLLPGGDLLVGGQFTAIGGVSCANTARWNGSVWTPFGPGSNAWARAVVSRQRGEVLLAGFFTVVGGNLAVSYARIASSCPATSIAIGGACSGGTIGEYRSVREAWLGAVATARVDAAPAPAFAAVVTGFTTMTLPLASLLPPSLPGCTLRVAPDAVDLALTSATTLETRLAIPVQPALIGMSFHRQVVFVELDAALAPIRSSSTNALTSTIGDL